MYGYADGDPINFSDPFGLYVSIQSALGRSARNYLLTASPTFAKLFGALHSQSRDNVNLVVRTPSGWAEMRAVESSDQGAVAERSPGGSASGRILHRAELDGAGMDHWVSMLAHEVVHSAGQYSEYTNVGDSCGGPSKSDHQRACFQYWNKKISDEIGAYRAAQESKDAEAKKKSP